MLILYGNYIKDNKYTPNVLRTGKTIYVEWRNPKNILNPEENHVGKILKKLEVLSLPISIYSRSERRFSGSGVS